MATTHNEAVAETNAALARWVNANVPDATQARELSGLVAQFVAAVVRRERAVADAAHRAADMEEIAQRAAGNPFAFMDSVFGQAARRANVAHGARTDQTAL
ncbi:hypothetical protein J421_4672 (plasmid) [Gemmatirosa kalamazoonensis]|uniref:Uncharacterized protein n=1 Tax=Gemmatirosa kalamazoonensis TaxID=861299 RepID=W0RP02_9BACT|nr:hypothetical protein [Gemmatirosa kalamazoonensis]AHG92139.1 hypothetical protein J421_4604 [Gemmatirosa kalamazoonensis]AHG92207.1 hypothetical protein J421_4672 [Gemmatirosa kalamazoonensis]